MVFMKTVPLEFLKSTFRMRLKLFQPIDLPKTRKFGLLELLSAFSSIGIL